MSGDSNRNKWFTREVIIALNFAVAILIACIAFMAKDIYSEVRFYPNTVIKQDMAELKKKSSTKANDEALEKLARQNERRYQALCEEIKDQSKKIDELNRFLRDHYSNIRRNHDSYPRQRETLR